MIKEPFRLGAGFSLVRLIHYPAGADQVHIDIPASKWVDAVLAMAAPPTEGWEAFHAGVKLTDDTNARLVRHEVERIHYGRPGR